MHWIAQHSTIHCNTSCNTLQHTATHSMFWYTTRSDAMDCILMGTLQHTATHTATRCNTLQRILYSGALHDQLSCIIRNAPQHTATTLQPHCNHTATHCNALQHTATHCNTLQHVANTLQHTLYSGALPVQIALHQERHSTAYRNKLQHKLQYTIYSSALRNQMRWNSLPPHCNTAKHTATYLNLTDALPPLQAPSPVLQS